MSAALTVRGLEGRRGAQAVLRGVDLDVAPGEICALMGTSGAGKTTVLRAVAALQPKYEHLHAQLRQDASARAADAIAELIAATGSR